MLLFFPFLCVFTNWIAIFVCLKFVIVSVSGESVVSDICVFVSILFLLIQLNENL